MTVGSTMGSLDFRTTEGAMQRGPDDAPIIDATTSLTGVDFNLLDSDGDGIRDLTPADTSGNQSSNLQTYLAPNGTGTRGVVMHNEGATAIYSVLDGLYTIEVVKPVRIEAHADGVAPSTIDYTPAVVVVTGPDGLPTPVVPGTPQEFFSARNAAEITMRVSVPATLVSSTTTPDGTGVNASAYAFRAEYFWVDDGNPGPARTDNGTVTQSTLNVAAQVPAGGIPCEPEPVVEPTPPDPTPTPEPATNPIPLPIPPLDPNLDSDRDGLSDAREAALGTNPLVEDTDGDRLNDGREVRGMNVKGLRGVRTDPLSSDTDSDGLTDGAEVKGFRVHKGDPRWRSHPLKADTDSDGLGDQAETTGKLNRMFGNRPTKPWDKDTDDDGKRDRTEIKKGRNPNVKGR